MTEPVHLQNRLVEAFGRDREGGAREADESGPADDASTAGMSPAETARSAAREAQAADDRMMRYWLAGGILLAIAALLAALGGSSGLLPAVVIGAIGLASLILAFAGKAAPRARPPGDTLSPTAVAAGSLATDPAAERPEHVADQRWQNNESAALLSAIHDALGDIAIRRSLNGTILHANNTFRDLVGESRPEGRTCHELGLHFQPGLVQHSYDVEIATPGGKRVFLWHDVVTRDPVLGELIIQSIARDVTDERQTALSQEAARRRAEMESENKSRLIATVAHEIRTPLSGLLGMGNLLARTQLAPDQANYLSGIRQSGTALIHLVEDLLDFSTIEAGRFTLRPRPEDIRPLVETVTEMLAPRAHEKGLEIGTHIDAGLADSLVLDAARLRQVLYNVAGNAVKFTDRGGILVTARLDGTDLILDVTDTGPGMNEAEIARIFNEFEQGDIAAARDMGVGLGLAISARILSEAGGKLTVSSTIGRGTTFQIRLPVSPDGPARDRSETLAASRVVVVAPIGPASEGLVATLKGLGARAGRAHDQASLLALIAAIRPTDVIVDHRSQAVLDDALASRPDLNAGGWRRVLLVDPESRPETMTGSKHDAWLIRPLRERSLVDVLLGRFSGLERRSREDDAFPSLPAVEDDRPRAVQPASHAILIGEDDPVNALIAQAALEKAGHKVRLTRDFTALAAALAEGPRPDLIITDFSMPGGSGDLFLADVRAAERASQLAELPVIVLTADTSEDTRRTLLAAGASLVMAKPFDPKVLAGTVLRLCSEAAARA